MEYRRVGRTGLHVSCLSFGSWLTFGRQVDDEVARRCMVMAFEAGVNFFDNAEAYAEGQSELTMGRVLKQTGWKRSDLVLSTKLFWGGKGPNDRGLSRKHLLEGIDASLQRMQLDYVDLLFCHRPDLHTPVEETVWAMDHIVRQGKALYWGTSEWSATRIMEAIAVARANRLVAPVVEQPQYNLLSRDRVEHEYAPLYRSVGLGTTVYSPLAGGLLTGKYNEGVPAGTRANLPGMEWLRQRFEGEQGQSAVRHLKKLTPIAAELGCNLAQLSIAWCLSNPRVSTVITGASKLQQLQDNLAALKFVPQLTPGVLSAIDAVLGNRPTPEYDGTEE